MSHGVFLFANKEFQVRQGRLTFDGSPTERTSLEILAEYEEMDSDGKEITVTAVLKGPLRDPKLSFFSNPALPETEIMALILFNKHVADISPLEAVQLGQTLVRLSQGAGGADLLNRIGQRVGLDRLDISTAVSNGSQEVTLQAGKYISRGVLVSVSRGIASESNRFAVEAKLGRQLKVIAETGDTDEGSKLFFKWQKDY